jgi:hypothetical protein
VQVNCPADSVPVGGGASVSPASEHMWIQSTHPAGHSWKASAESEFDIRWRLRVYAICVEVN